MAKSFNADQKAAEREQQDITIGGVTYHPARRKVDLMREFRRIARDDEKLAREQDRLEKAQDADEKVDNADEIEQVTERRERLTYEMIALFLAPSNGHPVSVDELMDELDIEDAGDLLGFLSPGDNEPDPTQPMEPTST